MWNLLWAVPATVLIVVIWAVSAIANYEHGLTQGTTELIAGLPFAVTSAMMNGYASLAVDGLKAILPAAAVVAWVLRYRAAAAGVVVMFLLCLAWSAQNSVGYVMSNSARAVDGRGQTADQWAALQRSLDEAQKSRGMVPEARPSAVVNADVAAAKAQRKFAESANCSDPARGKAVNFCNSYRGLMSELASAESADRLDAQLVTLRNQLDTRKRISDADPLASAAAGLLGFDRGSVVAGRSISFSLLVEVISAVGLALIWGIFAAARRNRKPAEPAVKLVWSAPGTNSAETMPRLDAAAFPSESVVVKGEYHGASFDTVVIDEAAGFSDADWKRLAEMKSLRDEKWETSGPKPTPPSGGGPRKRILKDRDEPAAPASPPVTDEIRPLRLVERAELPAFASEVFEESAPPRKHTAQRRREDRKHKAMGSAKEWLADYTERSDGAVCAAEDAWASYRGWCESEGMKQLPRSKFHNTISARVGSVSASGKRVYVGLILVQPVAERIRAVA